jgi:hypothetical protein
MMDIRKIRVFNVLYGVKLAIVEGLVDSDASGWQFAVTNTSKTRRTLWRVCTSVTHSGGKLDRLDSRMEVIGGRKEGVHCTREAQSTRV